MWNLWSRSWNEGSVSLRTGRFQALNLNSRLLCLDTPARNVPPAAKGVNAAQPVSVTSSSWCQLNNRENGTFTQGWFPDTHWSAIAEVLQSKTFIWTNREYWKVVYIKSNNQLIARPREHLITSYFMFAKQSDIMIAKISPYHTESPKETKYPGPSLSW